MVPVWWELGSILIMQTIHRKWGIFDTLYNHLKCFKFPQVQRDKKKTFSIGLETCTLFGNLNFNSELKSYLMYSLTQELFEPSKTRMVCFFSLPQEEDLNNHQNSYLQLHQAPFYFSPLNIQLNQQRWHESGLFTPMDATVLENLKYIGNLKILNFDKWNEINFILNPGPF